MRHVSRIALLGIGLCVLCTGIFGCSKYVPLEDGMFEAQQKVLVTLEDGRTVEGRIAPGNTVTYTNDHSVYRARVASVTETAVSLEELNLVDRADSYELVRARLAEARRWVEPPVDEVTLSREEFERVDLISFDPARLTRVVTFWGYGAGVVVLLLTERG